MPQYSRRWRPAGLVLIPGGHIGNHSPPLSTRLAGRRGCSVVDCRAAALSCRAVWVSGGQWRCGCGGGAGHSCCCRLSCAGRARRCQPAARQSVPSRQPATTRQLHSGNSGRGHSEPGNRAGNRGNSYSSGTVEWERLERWEQRVQ